MVDLTEQAKNLSIVAELEQENMQLRTKIAKWAEQIAENERLKVENRSREMVITCMGHPVFHHDFDHPQTSSDMVPLCKMFDTVRNETRKAILAEAKNGMRNISGLKAQLNDDGIWWVQRNCVYDVLNKLGV